MTTEKVRIEYEGDVAVVMIDNPPVNAGSTAVRQGLLDAIARIEANPALRAAVLIGAGGSFISGSDVGEFGKPLQAPELPAVIAAIETGTKTYVAALAGAALGGGYELALGCDARIATPGTLVGLPEVTLGMIPGAGGTQRLPRLVGISEAIALICGGTRVSAVEALRIGMVDRLAEGDLRAAGIAEARRLAGQKIPVSARAVPPEDEFLIEAAAQAGSRAAGGRPAAVAAIAAVRSAATEDFSKALAEEREKFTELRLSPEAAALRYLFFAERRAGRAPKGAVPRTLRRAGVIGAGTMGAGIAAALLRAGLAVTLVDLSANALARGLASVHAIIERWRLSGATAEPQDTAMRAMLSSGAELAAIASCDVVIEAIVEDAGAKAALLRDLDSVLDPAALIATNTSYLDLDALARSLRDPGRLFGLHFFDPAQTMRLLEIVRGAETRADTLAAGLVLARRMDKQPVLARVCRGFIGNRLCAAYRRQCESMLEDGAWPEQVDAALEAFGFAMGPFASGDLSDRGLLEPEIARAMPRAQAATRDPALHYGAMAGRLCEAGGAGRKTGDEWDACPDLEVRTVIETASAEKSIVRRDFTADGIVARVLVSVLNEAALLLAEGVAERASDIDVVFVHGYGFPRHEGGPLFWASRQDPALIAEATREIESATGAGAGFRRGGIAPVLAEIRGA